MSTTRIVFLVIGVILLVFFVFALSQLALVGWRILRGTDEFVAGGSMGHQMTSPVEHRHLARRFLRFFRKQRQAQQL
jgi:uncharacterized membrane protein